MAPGFGTTYGTAHVAYTPVIPRDGDGSTALELTVLDHGGQSSEGARAAASGVLPVDSTPLADAAAAAAAAGGKGAAAGWWGRTEEHRRGGEGKGRSTALLIWVVMVIGVLAALGAVSPLAAREAKAAEPEGGASVLGHTGTRDCTYLECKDAACDADTDPYLCVDKVGPTNGCFQEPWPVEICADSCGLKNCGQQVPPGADKKPKV